jgi:hypothetical protein
MLARKTRKKLSRFGELLSENELLAVEELSKNV